MSGYGGSDTTAPSFNRSQYVPHDSLANAQDLGEWRNFRQTLEGLVGSEVGRPTQFFRLRSTAPAQLRVQLEPGNPWTDRFLQVGVVAPGNRELGLDVEGRVRFTDWLNTPQDESAADLPPGDYTILVASSQWGRIPFRLQVALQVIVRLQGSLSGQGSLEGLLTSVDTALITAIDGGLPGDALPIEVQGVGPDGTGYDFEIDGGLP